MIHELKILPEYFEPVLCGDKTFEIRECKDRSFKKGDIVVLREVERGEEYPDLNYYTYTGRQTVRKITYVTEFAQKPTFCVFGIKELS